MIKPTKHKTCLICKKTFTPKRKDQKVCAEQICRETRTKRLAKSWRRKNQDYIKAYNESYRKL